MATKFFRKDSFDHYHTKGDTFDKSFTVTSPATWAGYASGKCEVRDSDGVLAYTLLVDITTNGVLRLYKATTVTSAEGTYFFDIQWTMSDGKIHTWVNNDQTLYKAIITNQSTI